MANLKRNMIELVMNPVEAAQGAEPEIEKFWSSPFIPLSTTYEALDLAEQMEKGDKSEKDMLPLMTKFIAEKIYGGNFTEEQLNNGLHAPDAIQVIQDQIIFIAQGQQTEATRNFLAKTN